VLIKPQMLAHSIKL